MNAFKGTLSTLLAAIVFTTSCFANNYSVQDMAHTISPIQIKIFKDYDGDLKVKDIVERSWAPIDRYTGLLKGKFDNNLYLLVAKKGVELNVDNFNDLQKNGDIRIFVFKDLEPKKTINMTIYQDIKHKNLVAKSKGSGRPPYENNITKTEIHHAEITGTTEEGKPEKKGAEAALVFTNENKLTRLHVKYWTDAEIKDLFGTDSYDITDLAATKKTKAEFEKSWNDENWESVFKTDPIKFNAAILFTISSKEKKFNDLPESLSNGTTVIYLFERKAGAQYNVKASEGFGIGEKPLKVTGQEDAIRFALSPEGKLVPRSSLATGNMTVQNDSNPYQKLYCKIMIDPADFTSFNDIVFKEQFEEDFVWVPLTANVPLSKNFKKQVAVIVSTKELKYENLEEAIKNNEAAVFMNIKPDKKTIINVISDGKKVTSESAKPVMVDEIFPK